MYKKLSRPTAFLEWLCQQLQSQGQHVLLLIWDNASWHVSKEVRQWLQLHNRSALAAQREGKAGVHHSLLVANQESLAQPH